MSMFRRMVDLRSPTSLIPSLFCILSHNCCNKRSYTIGPPLRKDRHKLAPTTSTHLMFMLYPSSHRISVPSVLFAMTNFLQVRLLCFFFLLLLLMCLQSTFSTRLCAVWSVETLLRCTPDKEDTMPTQATVAFP